MPEHPRRPLDTVERFWFVRGAEGGGRCIGILRLEGKLDLARAEAAVRALCVRHPVLGVCIEGEEEPCFAPARFPPPLTVEPGRTWQEVVREELARGFPTATGPLWRLRVVLAEDEPHSAVLAAHHSILDGHSQLRLLEDFARLCRRPTSPTVPPGPPLSSLLGLTPPKHPHPGFRARRIFPIEGQAPPEERTTRFLVEDLPAALVTRLSARIRRERTTEHATLSLAAVAAAHALCGPIEDFQLISPLCLRALCRPPVGPETIGCYASGLMLGLSMHSPEDFWTQVRAHHRQLLMAIGGQRWRHAPLDSPEALRAARAKVRAAARDETRQGRLADLVVSSAGDVAPDLCAGELRAVGYYEVASQHSSGHCFALWPHGCGPRLCLTLGWVEPVTSEASARRFFAELRATLERVCA